MFVGKVLGNMVSVHSTTLLECVIIVNFASQNKLTSLLRTRISLDPLVTILLRTSNWLQQANFLAPKYVLLECQLHSLGISPAKCNDFHLKQCTEGVF